MNNNQDLMNQINSIMKENKPSVAKGSKADREISYFESELLSNSILYPFFQTIAELAPECENEKLGSGSFTRKEYSLGWNKYNNDKFRLTLTNIPHNNVKLLCECPIEFKEELYRFLPRFVESIAEKIKDSE